MALVRIEDFGEYYNSLVQRQWSDEEILKFLVREEVGQRAEIEAAESSSFHDVLHVAAVMISDRKEFSRCRYSCRDPRALVLAQRDIAVWLPPEPHFRPASKVGLPEVKLWPGYPYEAAAKLMDEEAELRRWLYMVQEKLRGRVQEACAQSWFILTRLDDLRMKETRARTRLEGDEAEDFASMRRGVFLRAPPDYFRQEVIRRYGATPSKPLDPTEEDRIKDFSIWELEEYMRERLMADEQKALKTVYDYWNDVFDKEFFVLNHDEIVQRADIEEEQRDTLFPQIDNVCRNNFELTFHQTAAVALHSQSPLTLCLSQLCWAHQKEMSRRRASCLEAHEAITVMSPTVDVAQTSMKGLRQ